MGATSFKVKQSALRAGGRELRQYRNTLHAVHSSVEDVMHVMSVMRGEVLICASLSKLGSKTEQYAECAGVMATALSDIAELYGNTEVTLTGNAGKNEGTQIEDFLDYIIGVFPVDMIITRPHVIPTIIGWIVPFVSWNLLNSGIPVNASSTSTSSGWFGYEFDEDNPGVSAWIGKGSAEIKNDSAYAKVNGYIGKGEAEIKAEGGFMKTETKWKYNNGEWEEKEIFEFVEGEIGAKVSGDMLAGDAEVGVGDDMLGLEGKLEGAIGSGEAGIAGKFSISEDGVNANVEGKAMVAAVEGKASGTINILGIEITGKASGYAGAAGVEGTIGIKDNKFVLEGGGAALIGGSVGVEIGINEEGWDNFIDFITFWD